MVIDFVVAWVDGGDPAWRKLRGAYLGSEESVDESRYREWDILPYWFRAVERFAPWVNKIYFVTCGQCPPWLNRNHPKLQLVDHKDFIPAEYLPTFNSMTIELNLHRIPGLSEHFVYFNDDMHLNSPVTPEDFFVDGLPCETAVMSTLNPVSVCDAHVHTICNVMGIINSRFSKKAVLKKAPGKWYNLKYGKGLMKNLLNTPGSHFSCFTLPHVCSSMRKSIFEEVWELEYERLHQACKEKFRASNGINQYIMSFFNLCKGEFYPRSSDFGRCYAIGNQSRAMLDDIRHHRHKVICINDNADVADFEGEKAALLEALQQVFPNRSAFEQDA